MSDTTIICIIISTTLCLSVQSCLSNRIFSNIEEHQYYSLKEVHVSVHSDTVGNMINVKE